MSGQKSYTAQQLIEKLNDVEWAGTTYEVPCWLYEAILERLGAATAAGEPKPHDLPPGLERLYKAARPFVRLLKGTSGRIPTELLSFANWQELARAYDQASPPATNGSTLPDGERTIHCKVKK